MDSPDPTRAVAPHSASVPSPISPCNTATAFKGYLANFDCVGSDHRPVALDFLEGIIFEFHDTAEHGELVGDEELEKEFELSNFLMGDFDFDGIDNGRKGDGDGGSKSGGPSGGNNSGAGGNKCKAGNTTSIPIS